MKFKNSLFIFLIFICAQFFPFQLDAQYINHSINKEIISTVFESNENSTALKKKKILSLKNKSFAQKLNPFLYLGATLLYVYQNTVSEQLQANCMYQISCSEYTKKSIEKNGFVKGTLSGFHQLSNCFQGAIYEHPVYMINENGKINNLIDEPNQK
jgi:putative component of membrane protein insertase Oxa1/YidC/SpoIIIJ protein YidD